MKKPEKSIKLAFGLGNPEEKYEETRHNIGKYLLESVADSFKDLKNSKISKISNNFFIGTSKVYVNQSGEAVKELKKETKIKPDELLVIHDDTDIPFGYLKLQFNEDSAGHKGIKSVIKGLGTQKFWRMRVGTQPGKKTHIEAMDIVLKKFSPSEKTLVKKMVKKFPELLNTIRERGPRKASVPKNFFYT